MSTFNLLRMSTDGSNAKIQLNQLTYAFGSGGASGCFFTAPFTTANPLSGTFIGTDIADQLAPLLRDLRRLGNNPHPVTVLPVTVAVVSPGPGFQWRHRPRASGIKPQPSPISFHLPCHMEFHLRTLILRTLRT